jgi:peptide/nickel transport system permease protein
LLIALHRRGGTGPGWYQQLTQDGAGRAGFWIVTLLAVIATLAPLLAPFDPLATGPSRNAAPSLEHWFGTDTTGRDLMSRVLYGARYSLAIAVLSVLVSLSVGTMVGLVSAFRPGVGALLMRGVDAGLAFPRIVLLLVLFALWEDVGVLAMVTILGLTGWFQTSRIVQAEAQRVKRCEYILALRALGVSTMRILRHHVLPNVAAPIIVVATLGAGNIILIESGLAFLGVGLDEPNPSWGVIIFNGRDLVGTHPWIATIPGATIAVTVIGFSLLGDGLRRVLNPHRV